MTIVKKVNPVNPEDSVIEEAARVIRNNGTVIFPTETVYGLGANALDPEASMKIFIAKNRQPDNPLIVHIHSLEQLFEIVEDVPENITRIMKKVWPGPITFVVKKTDKIPLVTSGGLQTVAIRMPAHPVALKLIEVSGVPIGAPSANLATRPSPTKVEHIIDEMMGRVDMIIDGGETFFGVESTVIDVTKNPPVLLRPGPFTLEELRNYFDDVIVPDFAQGKGEAEVALSPGMKYKHYAPTKRVFLAKNTESLIRIVHSLRSKYRFATICSRETGAMLEGNKIITGSKENLYEVAKNLFDSLRKLDRMEVDFGIAEPYPERGIGLAIMNRLRKACAFTVVSSAEDLIQYLQT